MRYIDFHWRSGSWRRYGEWVFGIFQHCESGCILLECGFFQITILKGTCRSLPKEAL
jgi:hypothetical protein